MKVWSIFFFTPPTDNIILTSGWSFSDCEDRAPDNSRDRGRTGAVLGLSSARSGMVSVRGRPKSAPPRTNRKLNRAHR